MYGSGAGLILYNNMFDDLDPQVNKEITGNMPAEHSVPAPAANENASPVSAPNTSEPPVAAPENGLEDIFSGTDTGSVAETTKPEVFQPKEPTPGAAGPDLPPPATSGKLRRILMPVILLAGLGIFVAGGVFGYQYVIRLIGGNNAVIDEPMNAENTDLTAIPEENGGTTETKTENGALEETDDANSAANVQPVEPVMTDSDETVLTDSDNDGLSDQEEVELGTNMNSVDSDNDGLFDREEVKVYKTDPNKADTDGDGYTDGEEVRQGYNPGGEGRLYDLDQ